jgi:hypothetical protein
MPSNGMLGSCHFTARDAQVQALESSGAACVSPRMTTASILRSVL